MSATAPNRLVVLDCDGTLVDGQHHIIACMADAFARHDLPPPPAAAIRRVIGLSLPQAIANLVPAAGQAAVAALTETYKASFFELRRRPGTIEPLYDGAAEALAALAAQGWLLGIATGKGRRGLEAVLESHGLADRFVTLQTPDSAPGKPDPGMLRLAMAEAGAVPATTFMVGDSTYDIEMAVLAGVRGIGVAWGYHPVEALRASGAVRIVDAFGELPGAVALLAGPAA